MEKLDNESRGTVSFDYLALCDLEVVGPAAEAVCLSEDASGPVPGVLTRAGHGTGGHDTGG